MVHFANHWKVSKYCGINRIIGGSIFVVFVGIPNSLQINKSEFKVIFPSVGIRGYTKLPNLEPVHFTQSKKLAPTIFNESTAIGIYMHVVLASTLLVIL